MNQSSTARCNGFQGVEPLSNVQVTGCGHRCWSQGVVTGDGHREWSQGVVTAAGHRVVTGCGHSCWSQGVVTGDGHRGWSQVMVTATGHSYWSQHTGRASGASDYRNLILGASDYRNLILCPLKIVITRPRGLQHLAVKKTFIFGIKLLLVKSCFTVFY